MSLAWRSLNTCEAGFGPLERRVRGEGMTAHPVGKRLCPGCYRPRESPERTRSDLLGDGNLDGEARQLDPDTRCLGREGGEEHTELVDITTGNC